MAKQFTRPKGTRDIYYEEALIRRRVIDRVRDVFLSFGFSDLDTPAFELLETLQAKSGPEVEEQIYVFDDKGGRRMGLRFEFTASLGRVVASQDDIVRPFKRYQIGKVWRYESPQSNRYREFYQADVDIVGPYTMDCEAEIMTVVASALAEFGLDDYVFLLWNRKLLKAQLAVAGIEDEALQGAVMRGLDKLDKIGGEAVRKYVVESGVPEALYERFMALVPQEEGNEAILESLERTVGEHPQGREGIDELREILRLAAGGGLAEHIQLTPFLVRGLDYYTGAIFEVRSPALDNISFGGGGRYDTMVRLFGGQDAGAVGFAFGVERLVAVLTEKGLVSGPRCEALVMLAPRNKALVAQTFGLARELRAAGVPVFQHLGAQKLAKQLAYADRMGFPYVVVVGEQEVESDVFPLKDLRTGEQIEVPRAELAARILA